VIASKQTWDYFNRVLLLLSSDAELEEERIEFKWHSGQVAPGICLLLAIGVSARVGWNVNLVSVFVPFGLLSMAISWVNRRRTRKKPAPETYPFPSFNALSLLRRRTRLFSKTPYPELLAHRRIRHPLISAIVWLPTIAGWLLLSPIVLFFQTLPEKRRDTRIYLSSSESPSGSAMTAIGNLHGCVHAETVALRPR